jgi:methionine synthase II (cobalamin-independent)
MNRATSLTISNFLRVDQVGSLLRPQALKDAYARHGNGELSDSELTRVQEESVKELIAKQEAHGLSILTDGEYRRLNFQDSFVKSVAGFLPKKQTMQFQESHTVGGEALQRWVPETYGSRRRRTYSNELTKREPICHYTK